MAYELIADNGIVLARYAFLDAARNEAERIMRGQPQCPGLRIDEVRQVWRNGREVTDHATQHSFVRKGTGAPREFECLDHGQAFPRERLPTHGATRGKRRAVS